MGSNPSKATLKAIELVKGGLPVKTASERTGVHPDTIYKHPLYREFKQSQKPKS